MSDLLPVNEMFSTIQGEGLWTGTPAVFIRLQGCPVGCPWCDTKFTWDPPKPDKQMIPNLMLVKTEPDSTWAAMSPETVIEKLSLLRGGQHVVITGGEPCLYDLYDLTHALAADGRQAQIETSGTQSVICDESTWVTVSPKIGMPGGFPILAQAMARADEIKMVIGKQDDLVKLFELLDAHPYSRALAGSVKRVYLQPLSLNRRATDICVQAVIANNFRLSLQTHQMIGLR